MTKTNRSTDRIAARYIPQNATCILEHTNGSAAYAYERAGTLYAITFWGSSSKAFEHYRYRNEAERNQAIWKFRELVETSVSRKTAQATEKRAAVNTLKVGDILSTCWGYDQTNVEFYIVTRTVGKTRVYV